LNTLGAVPKKSDKSPYFENIIHFRMILVNPEKYNVRLNPVTKLKTKSNQND